VFVSQCVRLAVGATAQKAATDAARVERSVVRRFVVGSGSPASTCRRTGATTAPRRRQQACLDVEPKVKATRIEVAAHLQRQRTIVHATIRRPRSMRTVTERLSPMLLQWTPRHKH